METRRLRPSRDPCFNPTQSHPPMGTMTIHELPEAERPREKLAARGAAALSDSELIAIVLRTGMKGASAIDLGRQLLIRYGSLSALARCSVPELAGIKGVGL